MPITVVELTPHEALISAALWPLWQMVNIMSYNSVNTEVPVELRSLASSRYWQIMLRVWLGKMCVFPLVAAINLLTCHCCCKTPALVVLTELICFSSVCLRQSSDLVPNWLAVVREIIVQPLSFNFWVCRCARPEWGGGNNVSKTHSKFIIYQCAGLSVCLTSKKQPCLPCVGSHCFLLWVTHN